MPVSPASLSVDVDLGYTAAADKGTVTNTAGDDAEIPLANGTNAGLSLHNYSQDDKDKVDAIPLTGVPEVLGDLNDVDTTGETDGHVLAYDGSEWVPVNPASLSVDVDLDYTPAADKGTVTNTAGDDAVIPLATGTNAGLSLNNFSAADKDKLDNLLGDIPDASETEKGIIQLATAAEVLAGTDLVKAVTPKQAADHYIAKNIALLSALP